jgi:hypothetical protein
LSSNLIKRGIKLAADLGLMPPLPG